MPREAINWGGAETYPLSPRGRAMDQRRTAGAVVGFLLVAPAAYAAGGGAPPVVELPTLDIVSDTPISGTGVDVTKVPAAVTQIDSKEIEREKAPSVVQSLYQQTPSIELQTVTGNDLQ